MPWSPPKSWAFLTKELERLLSVPRGATYSLGGRERYRSADLALFRRALYQLSYPTRRAASGTLAPERT
jgi:hypothetical protein